MLINQKDAENSIQLAESSTEIANKTRKDSANMRTIAVLGMIYLPSSFLSSVFSTVFFNIDPEARSLIVYKEIWLFILAAVCCTASTLALWAWFSGGRISDVRKFLDKVLRRQKVSNKNL